MSESRKSRREFARLLGTAAMAGGLVASYGTCAAVSARFLYPARERARSWQLVGVADEIRRGEARPYQAPDGAPISIARPGAGGAVTDFVALSSTCPHLGCQVHWEPHNDRFFCPCHNGVFTPEGIAVSGPPADAGQDLPRFPLKIEGGLLYIQVPLVEVTTAAGAGAGATCAGTGTTPGGLAGRAVRRTDRDGNG